VKRQISTIAWIGIFGLGALAVYLVKYQVQGVKKDVVALQYELQQERESLKLLQAEWAYLNRPDRLRKLASRYLTIEPYSAKQIVAVESLPFRAVEMTTPIAFDANAAKGAE
jgi:hypothetical protein